MICNLVPSNGSALRVNSDRNRTVLSRLLQRCGITHKSLFPAGDAGHATAGQVADSGLLRLDNLGACSLHLACLGVEIRLEHNAITRLAGMEMRQRIIHPAHRKLFHLRFDAVTGAERQHPGDIARRTGGRT